MNSLEETEGTMDNGILRQAKTAFDPGNCQLATRVADDLPDTGSADHAIYQMMLADHERSYKESGKPHAPGCYVYRPTN